MTGGDPGGPARPPSIAAVVADAAARLSAAGLPDARLDARVLAAHALGLSAPGALTPRGGDAMPAEAGRHLESLLRRRLAREPVGRILGRRGFWTLDLALGPETLEPRPETETVVTAVLDRLPDRGVPLRLLDAGTGSGALLLALLTELPAARGVGVDIAAGAVAVARANARTHGLDSRAQIVEADWRDGLVGVVGAPLDVVVSNPPYVTSADLTDLAPEVRDHDPVVALHGGADGLACYRDLIPLAARLLRPGGWLAVEIGATQADAVSAIVRRAGFGAVSCVRDLPGHDRCVVGRAADSPTTAEKNRSPKNR